MILKKMTLMFETGTVKERERCENEIITVQFLYFTLNDLK